MEPGRWAKVSPQIQRFVPSLTKGENVNGLFPGIRDLPQTPTFHVLVISVLKKP